MSSKMKLHARDFVLMSPALSLISWRLKFHDRPLSTARAPDLYLRQANATFAHTRLQCETVQQVLGSWVYLSVSLARSLCQNEHIAFIIMNEFINSALLSHLAPTSNWNSLSQCLPLLLRACFALPTSRDCCWLCKSSPTG